MARHACLHDGIAGDREGKAVDDDAAQRFALHIDALPEARRAEEDGVRRGAELFEQRFARSGAVQKDRKVEHGHEAFVEVAHLRVAGEEAEGAAPRDLKNAADAVGGSLGKFRIARIGHVGRQVEQRLFAVAEVRRHDQFAGFGQAEPLAQMFEAALHGEGGGGEHDGGDGFEDEFVEQFGYVDGSGLKESVPVLRTDTSRGRLLGDACECGVRASRPCCWSLIRAGIQVRCAGGRRACAGRGLRRFR